LGHSKTVPRQGRRKKIFTSFGWNKRNNGTTRAVATFELFLVPNKGWNKYTDFL